MALESLRSPRPQRLDSAPSGLGDPCNDPAAEPGLCTVTSGHYGEQLPVAGMRVRDIRARFRDRFDIDPQAQAIVDGTEVGDDYVIRTGQALMFSRKAGEKGA